MDYITLGRTGVRSSVVGLGAGGRSKIGQSAGATFDDSVEIVKSAIDQGVTFFDTAARYGTEPIIGAALKGVRGDMIISTKQWPVRGSAGQRGTDYVTAEEFRAGVERSLKDLNTDWIDVLHLHGVDAHQYRYCIDELVPEMQRLREAGKIRFLGITEPFSVDTDHSMFKLAFNDDVWDVVMVGLNILNQSALHDVLSTTKRLNIGTLCQYAVRWGLVNQEQAKILIEKACEIGEVDPSAIDQNAPFGFLEENSRPIPLTEAAYRFCRHAPGMDVILTGTGNLEHLRENIRSILMPPLPQPILERLAAMFGNVRSISGNPLER